VGVIYRLRTGTWIGLAAAVIMVLAGCSASAEPKNAVVQEAAAKKINPGLTDAENCGYATLDYFPALKFNGNSYTENRDGESSRLKPGKKIGEIGYKMADNACPGYQMKDGDATLLEIGTPLYEVEGYKTDYRLFAGDRLYEVSENPSARTVGELYDIQGKIAGIRFESGNDGSPMKAFTEEAATVFKEEYLKLQLVNRTRLYKETKSLSGGSYFLRVLLKDGSSFRMSYYIKPGVLSPGAYATDELNEMIARQRERLYE